MWRSHSILNTGCEATLFVQERRELGEGSITVMSSEDRSGTGDRKARSKASGLVLPTCSRRSDSYSSGSQACVNNARVDAPYVWYRYQSWCDAQGLAAERRNG